jgi:hypothetical protein
MPKTDERDEFQEALDRGDAIAALDAALKAAGGRPTFDPHRSTAKPCVLCGTTSEPRDLITIGTYTRHMGGNLRPGDKIDRPMCARCVALTNVP